MRIGPWAALALVALAARSEAQVPAARWTLGLGVEGIRFAAAARDTFTAAGPAADLRPSGRVGIRLALHRASGAWRVGAAAGWAWGEVEAANDAVVIRDRTAHLTRYRVAASLERRLARLGAGELAVELSPVLDLWSLAGGTRARGGAECGAVLRVPLGAVAVEHRIALGLSASPLVADDVGWEFELRPLRTVGYGLSLRVPL